MNSAYPPVTASAGTLAMALIISSQAPLVLLDGDLTVVAASASFYRRFGLMRTGPGRDRFADLGGGEWNVPQLLVLLKATAAGRPEIEAYEMDLVRPGQPVCNLVLSAHKLDYDAAVGEPRIVLAITDITAAQLANRQKDQLLLENRMLMQELQHRIANSLQIIASVLLQSARKVNSEETRNHLKDAHHRVMSIATLQKQLATTQDGDVVLGSYFAELCESIAASMIADTDNFTLRADVDDSVVDARVSVSLGLIVTELVINALKHAFTDNRPSGAIVVWFRSTDTGWTLRIEDDGGGFAADVESSLPGLGTGIVEALASQLDATVTTMTTSAGTHVTINKG
ncbi:sensor histidine kinase [Novosphingobium sp.]|uniref:sensor histidine kinase n=1 Tax=Novosphingobium sp. TaxID=1874826 RepID=UPI0027368282|nr:sensor histidine kinase [Novosphingobium sp.]MDP3906533.1 sensor histidine kinase [Novosphingobium sp.]